MWLHLDIIRELHDLCRDIFAKGTVRYAYCCIPTYPSGQIGFMMCSKDPNVGFDEPKQPCPESSNRSKELGDLRYYSHQIHPAAFVLPQFAKKALGSA